LSVDHREYIGSERWRRSHARLKQSGYRCRICNGRGPGSPIEVNRAAIEGVAAMLLECGRVDGGTVESLLRSRGAEGAALRSAGLIVSKIVASPEKLRTRQ